MRLNVLGADVEMLACSPAAAPACYVYSMAVIQTSDSIVCAFFTLQHCQVRAS